MLETSKNIDISIRLGRTPQPTRLHGHQRALPQKLRPSSSKKAARTGETHDGSVKKKTPPPRLTVSPKSHHHAIRIDKCNDPLLEYSLFQRKLIM